MLTSFISLAIFVNSSRDEDIKVLVTRYLKIHWPMSRFLPYPLPPTRLAAVSLFVSFCGKLSPKIWTGDRHRLGTTYPCTVNLRQEREGMRKGEVKKNPQKNAWCKCYWNTLKIHRNSWLAWRCSRLQCPRSSQHWSPLGLLARMVNENHTFVYLAGEKERAREA